MHKYSIIPITDTSMEHMVYEPYTCYFPNLSPIYHNISVRMSHDYGTEMKNISYSNKFIYKGKSWKVM